MSAEDLEEKMYNTSERYDNLAERTRILYNLFDQAHNFGTCPRTVEKMYCQGCVHLRGRLEQLFRDTPRWVIWLALITGSWSRIPIIYRRMKAADRSR